MAPALGISIPTASTATPAEGKPFTQYHVVLQLPLRKHEIKKRYTDFTNLHDALVSQTNQAPPAPLPPKSWLRRTVNNQSLTEERRQGLEKYLKSIVEADDARWRSSSAWRSFLNLPSGNNTLSANGSLTGTTSQKQHGIADPNQWLEVHRDLKTQIQAARQQLKQREAATTAQQQHSLAAEAKASLVRAATSIAQLDEGLRRISAASKGDEAGWGGSSKLGEGEIRRRRDLLGAARKEVEGLEGVLRSMASKSAGTPSGAGTQTGAVASAGDKDALWKGTEAAKPKGRVLGGPLKETERTRELDNSGVLQLQQQIMEEQDEDVLSLGKTVAKLKDMGILIHEELEVQNAMLGMVEEDAGRVQNKIDVARSRIKKIR
ncbi:Phox-like protein [Hortaea werneckii]|nr:Phox-like protein [Hortaea werneckii]KAI7103728.1 Phox-like protein [Hortaea werneckii]KAI7232159.1 Phox-like protein [Hortaea werneckii]KAI7316925.1 Phox-like protein [Hortaea werneckii]